MSTKKDVFSVLEKVNANEYKKTIKLAGGKELSYLSWTDAITGVLRIYPDASWKIHEFPMVHGNYEVHDTYTSGSDGTPVKVAERFMTHLVVYPEIKVPYLKDKSGCYVQVSVTIEDREKSEILPVLDNYNKPIPNPNSFDINTSIKRCLAKCLALHGLGLYIYRGEDIPEVKPKPKGKPKVTEVKS